MKKLIPILLSACLLTALMAATVSADEQTEATPVIHFADEMTEPDVVFSHGSVPAESELADGIRLPIHALILSMWEHELSYDIHSAPFVWNALYYALSLYGQVDDRAHLTDEALLLPSEVVHDFANALFARLEALPSLPPEMAGFVSYDVLTDTYALSLGDFALTQLQSGELIANADGTSILNGMLTSLEDDTPLCTFRATLLENDTMFGFSILDVSLY